MKTTCTYALVLVFAAFYFFSEEACRQPSRAEYRQAVAQHPLDSLFDVLALLHQYQPQPVHIAYDVEMKKPKTYLGVQTRVVFSDLTARFGLDTSDYLVTFICKDGYSPVVPLSRLFDSTGYIVVRDIDTPGTWEESVAAKFHPAYLVWNIPADDHLHPFPYGLTGFRFSKRTTVYKKSKPETKDPEVAAGFDLYVQRCIKCHAIDGEGGKVASDLHKPVNIIRRWGRQKVRAYILDPKSVDPLSKMSPEKGLTDVETSRIMAYLAYLSEKN